MDLSNKYIFDGGFGIERETLRVTADGRMAQTPHPFPDDKYLDRDFCENQLELITPVCDSTSSLMETLKELDSKAKARLLKRGEYLWPSSNPPRVETEDDIPVARFDAEKAFKHDYRLNLERRYGKRIMLYSGIHFNFSFSEKLLRSICTESDYKNFKNKLYFRLLKQASRYSWLPLILTASSPVYDLSLDGDYLKGDGFDGFASRRSGEKGYWNQFVPVLDYTDLHTYTDSIRTYIKKGALFSAGELYLPVRLKPRGANNLDAFERFGADHIELRMFDVNPLSPLGIFREDLDFAHYFLIYLSSLPDFDFTPDLQETAIENHKKAAVYALDMKDEALAALSDMEEFFKGIGRVTDNIDMQKAKLRENNRYCVKVYEKYGRDFHKKMLLTAKGDGENV